MFQGEIRAPQSVAPPRKFSRNNKTFAESGTDFQAVRTARSKTPDTKNLREESNLNHWVCKMTDCFSQMNAVFFSCHIAERVYPKNCHGGSEKNPDDP